MARVLALLLLIAQAPTIRTTVPLVVAPVTVRDAKGKIVDGLSASDFVLTDNGRPQQIHVETHYAPISLVVAVQSGEIAAPALARIRKTGSLIEPLITGQRGLAAVITFDSEIRTLQEFTGDAGKITTAFRGVGSRGEGGGMIDAVVEGVRMLAAQEPGRRRVLIVISESRDRSSKSSLEDAVTLAQKENVVIYPVTYSPYASAFTTRPHDTPPPSSGGFSLLAIFREIGRLGKANAAEAFERYTGGRRASFLRQRGLEDILAGIGEELHGQYIVSFTPRNAVENEYHRIEVKLPNHPQLQVRTRPGYWIHW